MKKQKELYAFLAFVGVLILDQAAAWAITAPGSTTFAYDLYDVGVNDILNGPIGFVGGVMAMALGAILAMRQMVMPAIGTVLGGVFLLNGDNIVTSMGALIG